MSRKIISEDQYLNRYLEDIRNMQDRIQKAYKLEEGKVYEFIKASNKNPESKIQRAVRIRRRLLKKYEYHALFEKKNGSRECLTYAEQALMLRNISKKVKILEEGEEE